MESARRLKMLMSGNDTGEADMTLCYKKVKIG
jgi:hypothetical protein